MTIARGNTIHDPRQPTAARPLAPAALARVRSLVLLGGSLRPTDLTAGTQRSLLDLPLTPGVSLLAQWCLQAQTLRADSGLPELPVRVLLTQASPVPGTDRIGGGLLSLESDPFEYRGTGGVLRDITRGYQDEDFVLVANSAQVLLEPLAQLARAAALVTRDVCILVHENGTPSPLMLVRCGCLADLPDVGFCDMKEQALPKLATRYHVAVINRREPAGLSVRTAAEYIGALRQLDRRRRGIVIADDAFTENWQPTFGLIDEGATVDPSAHLHDSVVLAGATVEAGAVLVRSVICAGAVVGRDAMVVDEVVSRR
jgi:hypothetical protein